LAEPSSWFAGVDLASVSHDSDDSGITISDDDNANLAAIIIMNIGNSFQLTCDS
jgi:hypothetical protein